MMGNSRETPFEILPTAQLREKYGLTAENRPTITLNPRRVPASLRPLIPLVEIFGISDDLIREDVVSKSPREATLQLKWAVEKYADELDQWLAGSEAAANKPSQEYVAFSAMRIAAESVGA
jgi:hypothetical protein